MWGESRSGTTAFKAAAERLLAGTPLRSLSGKLTATELIVESGLRRDVVYPQHQNLVDEVRLRAKAQDRVPAAAQELAERYATVVEALKRRSNSWQQKGR
ncbi:hypothetical protein [Streptomyces sp. NPDC058683]|uniref:hypothetical protein n=1 Tax=Streptomyces sp. NPDC058683 TaxID=3346597 RepID=UPI0036611B9B